jgi:hypothetical protein
VIDTQQHSRWVVCRFNLQEERLPPVYGHDARHIKRQADSNMYKGSSCIVVNSSRDRESRFFINNLEAPLFKDCECFADQGSASYYQSVVDHHAWGMAPCTASPIVRMWQ